MPHLLTDADILKKAVPVKFVGGKYKKKKGFLDPTRTADDRTTPIIVNDPSKGGWYQTFVANGNWREITNDEPMSFAEAVFLVPEIEASIIEVCRKIVKFDITKDERGLQAFKDQFGKELMIAQKWQEDKKDAAVWRRIKEWEQGQYGIHDI